MTTHTPPVDILAGITPALEPTFRLDQLVALSPERALYKAWDRSLKRSVALRLHLVPGSPGREWFVRETETLAALDHPAIRHVYALGEVEPFAYRTANWIDGESLADAIRRGARPIPAAMSVVRDLLGALEHAHAHGIIIRRIAPTTLMLDLAGRAIITDLRFSSWCLAHAPADLGPGAAFCAAGGARWQRRGSGGGRLHSRRARLLRPDRAGARRRTGGDRAAPAAARHDSRGGRARDPAGPVRRARRPLLHRDRDARGFRVRRGYVPRARRRAAARRVGVRAAAAPRPGRRLRAARGDRRRWIRPRVSRAGSGPGAGSGDQGAAPVTDRGPRRRRALPARGAARGAAAPPQHREHLRHRATGGAAMVHDGARPRRQPRASHRGARPLAGGPRRPAPRRSALGAGTSARAGPGAPRPEARERAARARWPRAHHRLRPGARAARRRPVRRRHVPQRDAAVRQPRAAARREGHAAHRSVFARGRGLLRAAGAAPVRGADP